jgi:hypothetical protein
MKGKLWTIEEEQKLRELIQAGDNANLAYTGIYDSFEVPVTILDKKTAILNTNYQFEVPPNGDGFLWTNGL